MPRGVFHPDDVPMLARLPQRVLRLGHAPAESREARRFPDYSRRFVNSMLTKTVSWGGNGSGRTSARAGSTVAVTAWRD